MGLQNPQSISMSLVPLAGRMRSGNAIMPANLKYPAGYFAPTVMPMQIIRPAPASAVIGYYSADYYGYVGQEKELRIAVQGGAFPYAPVIVSAPTGATIGTDPNDKENYMVLRFACTEEGTDSIIVNVFDNDETMLKINITHITDNDAYRFVETTGSNITGSGTLASPWQTLSHAFSNTTGGRILDLGDGTYNGMPLGLTLSSATLNSIMSRNPRGANLDYASNAETAIGSAFYINSPNCLISGIVVNNPQNACQNPRIFNAQAVASYTYMDNCRFNVDGRSGTLNNDNVSCFYFANPGSPRTHIAQTRCEFTGFAGLSNGWSCTDMYNTRNVVIEANVFSDQRSTSTGAGIIWIKGDGNRNIDVRLNEFETVFGGGLIDIYLANLTENNTGNVDVSYNLIRCTGNAGIWVFRADQAGARLPVWSRNNTIVGGVIMLFRRSFNATFSSDRDVIQSSITSTDPYKVVLRDPNDGADLYRPLSDMPSLTASITNYECQQSSGVVDADGQLLGSYFTNYRGQRGHNIWKP